MKKSIFLFSLLAATLMSSCSGFQKADSSSTSSSSATTGGNTLTSVLSSFGTNLTVAASFPFLSKSGSTPTMLMSFIDQGSRVSSTGFSSTAKTGGFVVVKDGAKAGVAAGTYAWTEDTADTLTLGSAITGSFRDVYYTPDQITKESASYVSAFVPEIAGTTNGYFYLNKEVDSTGKRTYANQTLLNNLAKYLGVYDTITSVGEATIDWASLYFSATGTQFTFSFYSRFNNGYTDLKTNAVVGSIGTTEIKAINSYFAPSLTGTPDAATPLVFKVGGAAQTIALTTDANAIITATSSKDYFTVKVEGTTVTITPLQSIAAGTDPFGTSTTLRATITIKASNVDGFYSALTYSCRLTKA
jgi:hypothetical protein